MEQSILEQTIRSELITRLGDGRRYSAELPVDYSVQVDDILVHLSIQGINWGRYRLTHIGVEFADSAVSSNIDEQVRAFTQIFGEGYAVFHEYDDALQNVTSANLTRHIPNRKTGVEEFVIGGNKVSYGRYKASTKQERTVLDSDKPYIINLSADDMIKAVTAFARILKADSFGGSELNPFNYGHSRKRKLGRIADKELHTARVKLDESIGFYSFNHERGILTGASITQVCPELGDVDEEQRRELVSMPEQDRRKTCCNIEAKTDDYGFSLDLDKDGSGSFTVYRVSINFPRQLTEEALDKIRKYFDSTLATPVPEAEDDPYGLFKGKIWKPTQLESAYSLAHDLSTLSITYKNHLNGNYGATFSSESDIVGHLIRILKIAKRNK